MRHASEEKAGQSEAETAGQAHESVRGPGVSSAPGQKRPFQENHDETRGAPSNVEIVREVLTLNFGGIDETNNARLRAKQADLEARGFEQIQAQFFNNNVVIFTAYRFPPLPPAPPLSPLPGMDGAAFPGPLPVSFYRIGPGLGEKVYSDHGPHAALSYAALLRYEAAFLESAGRIGTVVQTAQSIAALFGWK